jgi:pyruvate ferredoxin oxidoreductase beta subunit
MSIQSEMHLYAPGHAGCPGCGPSTTLRHIVDTLGKDIIVVNATGCMEITSSLYPTSAWRVPYIHANFENAASVATGVSQALRSQGNNHTLVVCIAGDGSTYDIGFSALSGAFDRNEDFIYCCYDNQLYANTGVQKSGATPFLAETNTTQFGSSVRGNQCDRKPIVEIAASHGIPYAASASIAFIADLKNKLQKAAKMKGSRFIAIDSPCCLGAGFEGRLTFQVARLAVQTRLWQLFEFENGFFKLNYDPQPAKPVGEYLSMQKRFKKITVEETASIQKKTDANWEKLLARLPK